MQLQAGVEGAEPEKVIVLELVGTVANFIAAVKRIDGLEWLADLDQEDIPPDSDFFRGDDPGASSQLSGQLYLIMSNKQAADQLVSLWRQWARDPDYDFGWGRRSLRQVLEQLRSVRFWGVEDRLRNTGILEDWRAMSAIDISPAPFEVELWYRGQETSREAAAGRVRSLILGEGGRVLSEAQIPEIRYHAFVGELPRQRVERVLENEDSAVIVSDDVMFLRPIGQFDVSSGEGDIELGVEAPSAALPTGTPIAALLDGLPLENHALLAGRLVVDDPDNWSVDYQARERLHGTAMASLIIHGDTSTTTKPIDHPLYVRPVLLPDPYSPLQPRPERAPYTRPYADIVREAVERMFTAEAGQEPAAPTVEIVNFSIGDVSRMFAGQVSPLARLIDWLSYLYGVLFVISGGNQMDPLSLDTPNKDLPGLTNDQMQNEVLVSMLRHAHVRRLLSPAEAINGLSVGWTNADNSGTGPFAVPGRNPFASDGLASTGTPIGPGFRRAIKPDVHFDGGRQFVEALPGDPADRARVIAVRHRQPPGHQVATPGPPGQLNARMYARGTSNAAALLTREIIVTRDVLLARLRTTNEAVPNRRIWAAMLKALTVHGASWGTAAGPLNDALGLAGRDGSSIISRFIGFGHPEPGRARLSSDQRATVIGWGELASGQAHRFDLPLPASLSGQPVFRRLALTLAWLSPIYSGNRRYRRAALWFTPPLDELGLERTECDWQAVQRGTVQHEIFDGRRATAFGRDDTLALAVNCRDDAGRVEEAVPYALVATLEVAEETTLPIYQEIEAALTVGVRIAPRAS